MQSISSSERVIPSEGVKAHTTTSKAIQFQTHGRLCALNAIANAITIPPDMYEKLKQDNPSMEQIVERLIHAGIAEFLIVRREFAGTLQAKMLEQKSGIFVFRFGRHIATWDANSQVILDPDPEYPNPLPINEFLDALKPPEELTKAYKIVPCTKDLEEKKERKKDRNKRQRENQKKRKRVKVSSTETTTAAVATTAPSEAPLEAPSAGPSMR